MLLLGVFSVMYFIGVCAAQDAYIASAKPPVSEDYKTVSTLLPMVPSTAYASKPKANVFLLSKIDKLFTGESVTFKCTVDISSGWDYLWYHNGIEIQGLNTDTYRIDSIGLSNIGQYHCKAKRDKGAFYTEPSEKKTLQVSDKPTPVLKVLGPWLDVFPTETVELKCEVASDEWWEVIWYKDGTLLQDDPIMEKDDSYLNITSATQTYQGNYTCKAQLASRGLTTGSSNGAYITVYGSKPQPTLSKDLDLNPTFVGETVTFTCRVDVASNWKYMWYKDGTALTSTSETLSIHLGLSDAGKYSCQAIRGDITSDRSKEITQLILEIPVPSLSLSTQWPNVFPTERVELHCGMLSGLNWTYTWFRDGQAIQADDDRATLSISSASVSHAGEYTCKGHLSSRSVNSNFSPGLSLTVYATKPSVILTQFPEYNIMFPGESVSFSCHVNGSTGWDYQWYKDGDELQRESSEMYPINSVEKANSGSYECKAKRGRNPHFLTISSQPIHLEIKEKAPKPLINQQPNVNVLYTGESVLLSCTLEISWGWEYNWYKDGLLFIDSKASFTIHNVTTSHNGIYSCSARRSKRGFIMGQSDGHILETSEIPVPVLKRGSSWLDVFPTENVKLSCGMQTRSDWTYTWYRDGAQISRDDVSLDSDGTTLSIHSASASHRGQYSCSGNFKSRPVKSSQSPALTLVVYDTKPIPELKQFPDDNLMHTGDSVSFSCGINVSSGWEYVWYKDGNLQTASGNNHTISPLVTSNSGSYTCQAKRGDGTVFSTSQSQAARFIVAERPKANIVLLTGWSEVFSTDSLMLKCEVQQNQDTWDYLWFKEGKRIDVPQPSEKYKVTPQDDPVQSSYFCRGIRKGKPSYSKDSSKFPTKNLLLKRRLLLSISGLLFFGIIAVFIGCIVFRVTRKSENEYEKPEETEMFLTMAQLKDRGDAPCPMVDFITDEALKVPSKEEGGENGTIGSESTPLPISVQDVTTESLDTAESNGGLASFKQ